MKLITQISQLLDETNEASPFISSLDDDYTNIYLSYYPLIIDSNHSISKLTHVIHLLDISVANTAHARLMHAARFYPIYWEAFGCTGPAFVHPQFVFSGCSLLSQTSSCSFLVMTCHLSYSSDCKGTLSQSNIHKLTTSKYFEVY